MTDDEKFEYPSVWVPANRSYQVESLRCWADSEGFGPGSIIGCYLQATTPLGLCDKHHVEIVGQRPEDA